MVLNKDINIIVANILHFYFAPLYLAKRGGVLVILVGEMEVFVFGEKKAKKIFG